MKDFSTIPNTTGSFPTVESENCTGPGTTDGTPITKDVLDDIWGAMQAVASEGGETPSGNAEVAGTSQLLDAVKKIIKRLVWDMTIDNLIVSELNAVAAWSDELYCAIGSWSTPWWIVGGAEGIQTSPIATSHSWTEKTPTGTIYAGAITDPYLSTVIAFVVGSGGQIYTTEDDTTWTSRSAAGGYNKVFYGAALAYGGGVGGDEYYLIAVGEDGEVETSANEGLTWTKRTQANAYADNFRAVAYGIVGTTHRVVAVGETGEIEYSDDGVTWTQATPAGAYAGTFYGIAFGPVNPELNTEAAWVAVGSANEIQWSSDGITWYHADAPSLPGDNLMAVAWGLAGFVAVGLQGSICSSLDALTWKARCHDLDYGDVFRFFGIASDRYKYVLVGNPLSSGNTVVMHTLTFRGE